jgi:elongation factor Ts
MAISAKDVMELRKRTNAPMMECKAALEEAAGEMEKAEKVLRERGITKMAKRADRETAEGVLQILVGEGNRRGTAVVVTCETDFTAKNAQFQAMANAAARAAHALEGDAVSSDQVLEASDGGKSVRTHFEEVANAIRENMGIAEVVRFGGICGSYVHFDKKSGALLEVDVADAGKASSPELAALLRDVAMHVVAFHIPPLAVDSSGIDPKAAEDEREILVKQAVDSGKSEEIAHKMVDGRMKKWFSERALLDQPFIKNGEKTVAQALADGEKAMGTTIKVKRFRRFQIGG